MTVLLIATGGSIAEYFEGGAIRHADGTDLVQTVMRGNQLSEPVETVDLMAVPSTWMTPTDMYEIGEAVRRACADPDVTGVVVTHGTATMEETAFWVDLVIDGEKPVALTGSQRYPGTHGYDGYRNIQDALLLAASPAARGLGCVVVMDGEIHAARDVTKAHPTSMAGFRSPLWGPLGRIDFGKVQLERAITARRDVLSPRLPLPRVDLLTCYAGMTGDVIDAVLALGGAGLVLESMTSGGITRDMVGAVKSAVDRGVVVAISSRCADGRVMRRSASDAGIEGYAFDLQQLGVALSELQAPKARLRMIALLSSDATRPDVFRRMDTAT